MELHISFKVLFAMLLSCAAWGRYCCAARVRCCCDNFTAVQRISKRSCRDPPFMHLLQCLFYLEAFFQFELVAVHIPRVSNDGWQMICPVITCPPSSSRHLPWISTHSCFPCSSLNFSSTSTAHGHPQPGQGSALLYLPWPSGFHPPNL